MKSPLVRCPTCKRHIYAAESSCPFCTRQPSASPALLAAALTAGMALVGCGSEAAQQRPPVEIAPPPDNPPNQPKEIAEDPKPDPNAPVVAPAPAYGGPPPPVQPPAAAYGAPPPMAPMPIPQPKP